MRFRLAVFLVIGLMIPVATFAQDRSEKTEADPGDAASYLDVLEKLKGESVEVQIETWHQYLQEQPETSFRPEIESNLRSLESLLVKTDPKRKREEQDTERYFRAVEFSKKLSLEDQIALWEQFLDENPKSMYRPEAKTTLERLRVQSGKRVPTRRKDRPIAEQDRGSEPVTHRIDGLNRTTGIALSATVGLVVPGMGHWYARDYPVAGILTGLRAGALGLGIPGIVKDAKHLLVGGIAIYGFTYLYDLIATPFAIDRYNENLESKHFGLYPLLEQDDKNDVLAGLVLTGRF